METAGMNNESGLDKDEQKDVMWFSLFTFDVQPQVCWIGPVPSYDFDVSFVVQYTSIHSSYSIDGFQAVSIEPFRMARRWLTQQCSQTVHFMYTFCVYISFKKTWSQLLSLLYIINWVVPCRDVTSPLDLQVTSSTKTRAWRPQRRRHLIFPSGSCTKNTTAKSSRKMQPFKKCVQLWPARAEGQISILLARFEFNKWRTREQLSVCQYLVSSSD